MNLRNIDQLELDQKTIFCRLDLNVPLRDGKITDESRIMAAMPTIKKLLSLTPKVILASHLGRPKGPQDSHLSLEPVAKRIADLLGKEALLVQDYDKEPCDQLVRQLNKNQFIVLENLRFYKGENENSDQFVENLVKGVDLYVNDAFGTCHRAHASIVGLPEKIGPSKCAAGYLIQKEVEELSQVKNAASSPFTTIVGGAKVSDKIGVILNLLNSANHLMIGGAMAYSFLAYKGVKVGNSRVEKDKLDLVETIYRNAEARKVSIHLPCDHICAERFDEGVEPIQIDGESIPDGLMGLDIGPKTASEFAKVISQSKTVLWNGPMGVFEWPSFSQGTDAIAHAVADCDGKTIVGGGDSVAALVKSGLSGQVSHVSTGGGASLEFLEGKTLPGLKVLQRN